MTATAGTVTWQSARKPSEAAKKLGGPKGYAQQLVWRFRHDSLQSYDYYRSSFPLIGWVCLVCIPSFYLIEWSAGVLAWDTLYLRALMGGVGGVLIFESHIKRSFLAHYWIAGLTFVLPFGVGLMLVLNTARSEPQSSLPFFWNVEYIIALFIFIQHVNSALISATMWTFASVLCALPLIFFTEANWEALRKFVLVPIPAYFSLIVLGTLSVRNLQQVRDEKAAVAYRVAEHVAHELRTPLASIRLNNERVKRNYEELTNRTSGNSKKILENKTESEISKGISGIGAEVEHANAVIDMLLVRSDTHAALNAADSEISVHSCITEAIRRFPFNNKHEESLVSIRRNEEYRVLGNRTLFVHVLFNLIKNALLFAQKCLAGSVTIESYVSGNRGVVRVCDTGPGIAPSVQSQVFKPFYSTLEFGVGTGIGLDFCKRVVDEMDGRIVIESSNDDGTVIAIWLPLVNTR